MTASPERSSLEAYAMEPQLDAKKTSRTAASSETNTALLAAIIDSSNDSITAMSLDGTVTSWNRGAEIIYGYLAEEIVGKSINVLIHPDRPDETDEIHRRIRN